MELHTSQVASNQLLLPRVLKEYLWAATTTADLPLSWCREGGINGGRGFCRTERHCKVEELKGGGGCTDAQFGKTSCMHIHMRCCSQVDEGACAVCIFPLFFRTGNRESHVFTLPTLPSFFRRSVSGPHLLTLLEFPWCTTYSVPWMRTAKVQRVVQS